MTLTHGQAALLNVSRGASVKADDTQGQADLARLARLGYVNLVPSINDPSGQPYQVTVLGRAALSDYQDQKALSWFAKLGLLLRSLRAPIWSVVSAVLAGVLIWLFTG